MVITRAFPIILAEDLPAEVDFYVKLLGFEVTFNSDWFVDLRAASSPGCEIAIWRRDHVLIQPFMRGVPQGIIINVVLEDVDSVHAAAKDRGIAILQELRDEQYGQRHFIIRDPAGTLVDVSTPIEMSASFTEEHDLP